MDRLKEQYDTELQALRESVEEATRVSWTAAGVGMPQENGAWAGIKAHTRQLSFSLQSDAQCPHIVGVELVHKE